MWCPEGMSYHAVVTAPTHVQDLVCLILLLSQFQTPGMNNTLVFCFCHYYFGGARSKGFATLRNVSKLQFFDKIGHAKSVDFRFYSAI